MMMSKQIVVDNLTYEVVALVHDNDTEKDYVVFTDGKTNNLKLSCVRYRKENKQLIPIKLETTEEKEAAVEIIKEVMNQLNSNQE